MRKKIKKHGKKLEKKQENLSNRVIALVLLMFVAIGLFFFIKSQRVEQQIVATDQSMGQGNYLAQANQNTSAFLTFDPTTKNAQVGDTVDVKIMVDTAGSETLSTDAYILFEGDKLQATSVVSGDFFPSVGSTIANNSVVVRGMVTEPASFRKGVGLLATVKFKALKQSVVSASFYCDAQAGDTSKIVLNNIDAQNIINCGGNNTIKITIGNPQTTVTFTPAPTTKNPTPTKVKPTPTSSMTKEQILKVLVSLILIIFVILMIILGL